MLLKDISALLPNNLSKITANNLLMGDTKLFLLLRWMVKILDYPSYQKLKASFQGLYLKASQDTDRREEGKMQRMKAASLGNMLEKTQRGLKTQKHLSTWVR